MRSVRRLPPIRGPNTDTACDARGMAEQSEGSHLLWSREELYHKSLTRTKRLFEAPSTPRCMKMQQPLLASIKCLNTRLLLGLTNCGTPFSILHRATREACLICHNVDVLTAS